MSLGPTSTAWRALAWILRNQACYIDRHHKAQWITVLNLQKEVEASNSIVPVEWRRVGLEKYLWRLAAYPVIGRSDEFRVFLQVQRKFPLPTSIDVALRVLDGAVNLPKQLLGDSGSVIGSQKAVQPAKAGRDLLRMFKELKRSVTNDWGGSKSPLEEEDNAFLDKKERLCDIEQQISGSSQQIAQVLCLIGQTLILELPSLHLKAEKLETASSKIFGGDKTRICKVEELKEAIRVTEDAKNYATREYERIKETIGVKSIGLLEKGRMIL
ncbi:hypothetical protein NMG60_11034297 [Bertholletia excelsa]